jgi:hypothetical protein
VVPISGTFPKIIYRQAHPRYSGDFRLSFITCNVVDFRQLSRYREKSKFWSPKSALSPLQAESFAHKKKPTSHGVQRPSAMRIFHQEAHLGNAAHFTPFGI